VKKTKRFCGRDCRVAWHRKLDREYSDVRKAAKDARRIATSVMAFDGRMGKVPVGFGFDVSGLSQEWKARRDARLARKQAKGEL